MTDVKKAHDGHPLLKGITAGSTSQAGLSLVKGHLSKERRHIANTASQCRCGGTACPSKSEMTWLQNGLCISIKTGQPRGIDRMIRTAPRRGRPSAG